MKKRKPWWSDGRGWAAALIGGLWLLLAAPPAVAAEKATAKKTTASARAGDKGGKSNKKPAKKSGRPAQRANRAAATDASPELGVADVIGGDSPGLHGEASFYGQGFHGRRTATGDVFDVQLFTAASNRFPLGTKVAVQRVDNGRCAIVKINDRMHPRHRRRVIDVSRGVAEYLGMLREGVVLVRVDPVNGRVGPRCNNDDS